MSDGLSFDEAPAESAPVTVRCGSADHQLFRGEVAPIENSETHCFQALVMAAPIQGVPIVELRRCPLRDPILFEG